MTELAEATIPSGNLYTTISLNESQQAMVMHNPEDTL
jgi:hypothetical protein